MRNWKIGLLSLLMATLIIGCAKEDKKDEVTAKLNGTSWSLTEKLVNGTDQTPTADITINFQQGGGFIYTEVPADTTTLITVESSWEVNTAGTQIEVDLFADYEIGQLSNTVLKLEYSDNGNQVKETYQNL